MDKQTLSNYGWIVICILVLCVMIALATPFGSFIASGIKSTTQGLFDVNQKAFNNVGFGQIPDQSFEDSYNGNGTGGAGSGSGGGAPATLEQAPQGFYYDVLYIGSFSDSEYANVVDKAFIFKKDGTAIYFDDSNGRAVCAVKCDMTYSFDNSGAGSADSADLQVNADGTQITYTGVGFNQHYGTLIMRSDIAIAGVEFEKTYADIWDENDTFTFHSDNTATYTFNGRTGTCTVDWKCPFIAECAGIGIIKLAINADDYLLNLELPPV